MSIAEQLRTHDGLLSMRELATLMGITIWTIYNLIHSGAIPFIKMGKLYKFNGVDVANWVEEKTHKLDEKQLKVWLSSRGFILTPDQITRVWAVLSEEMR
jgi:excisionase family DNA binding protein